MEDKRFAHIKTDPKFRRIPKGERKVKIDKRFQSMFSDKKFKVKYTIDKRGRPVNHNSSEDLKRYYELTSGSSSCDSHSESENEYEEIGRYVQPPKSESVFVEQESDLQKKTKSDKIVPEDIKNKLKNLDVDYARGEGTLFSESSSDDEETDDEVNGEDINHKWGELDADAETTDETTCRLAACNMDWDRIRAIDLMVLLNSFLPQGGMIKSVTIYPSEFGKKRMQEEEIKGPIELVESKVGDEKLETEEGSEYHMEKLRQYQLNRLKYYYAVIVFDSISSANKVYTECDGMEYESSATKLDLRFIPNNMTFADIPKEVCDKLPEFNKYQPRFFTTTALQQVKVDLTWDETDPDRIEITEKLHNGKADTFTKDDLQNFLAGSSDEERSNYESDQESEADESDNPINKYKSLLEDIENQEKEKNNKDVEMEITWGIDTREKTEKLIKKKLSEQEEKTPFQRYLDKRKEKRKEKRELKKETLQNNLDEDSDMPSDIDINDPYFAEELNNPDFKKKKVKQKIASSDETENQTELELLLLDEHDNKNHFNLEKIQEHNVKKSNKKKGLKDEITTDDFEINANDDRFSALFNSHLYNIDPTDPHFKKTKGMDTLISEKLKRRAAPSSETMHLKRPKTLNKKDVELNLLVKSVKRKTETYRNK